MRRSSWALVWSIFWFGNCTERKPVVTASVLACGTAGLEGERCAVGGETCPCSGFECPTYGDGFCTAVCSAELVWALEDCGRARPPVIGNAGGAAGEAGAAGAAGGAP
jgi:hypothetical protein